MEKTETAGRKLWLFYPALNWGLQTIASEPVYCDRSDFSRCHAYNLWLDQVEEILKYSLDCSTFPESVLYCAMNVPLVIPECQFHLRCQRCTLCIDVFMQLTAAHSSTTVYSHEL